MFENLRQDSSESPLFQEEPEPTKRHTRKTPLLVEGKFLGMDAKQRFAIATLLMLMMCTLSFFCLFATEKIYIPFF